MLCQQTFCCSTPPPYPPTQQKILPITNSCLHLVQPQMLATQTDMDLQSGGWSVAEVTLITKILHRFPPSASANISRHVLSFSGRVDTRTMIRWLGSSPARGSPYPVFSPAPSLDTWWARRNNVMKIKTTIATAGQVSLDCLHPFHSFVFNSSREVREVTMYWYLSPV